MELKTYPTLLLYRDGSFKIGPSFQRGTRHMHEAVCDGGVLANHDPIVAFGPSFKTRTFRFVSTSHKYDIYEEV